VAIAKQLSEFPEIIELRDKLTKRESLNNRDLQLIDELSKETGWSVEDIMDEIKDLDKEPSTSVDKYQKLFEKYFNEALELKEKGDYIQAGEKLWGAVTALIKLYASRRNITVMHWSHGKLFQFVKNNIDKKPIKILDGSEISPREAFYEILIEAGALHDNFYEGDLPDDAFEMIFNKVVRLMEKVKEIV